MQVVRKTVVQDIAVEIEYADKALSYFFQEFLGSAEPDRAIIDRWDEAITRMSAILFLLGNASDKLNAVYGEASEYFTGEVKLLARSLNIIDNDE